MSEHQISLPKEVYNNLLTVAHSQGISPADWIASKLPTASTDKSSIAKSVLDLIGAIDSQQEPYQEHETTFFGEAIAAELAKQGLKRP